MMKWRLDINYSSSRKYILFLHETLSFEHRSSLCRCACSQAARCHQQYSRRAAVIKCSTGRTERLLHLRRQISIILTMTTASPSRRSKGHINSLKPLSDLKSQPLIMQNMTRTDSVMIRSYLWGAFHTKTVFFHFKLCVTPSSLISWAGWISISVKKIVLCFSVLPNLEKFFWMFFTKSKST